MATIEEHPSAERRGASSRVAYERVQEWEGLYQQHHRSVLTLCRKITGDPALAEDLTQETFIRILQRPPRYLPDDSWPWVARVAHNVCVDELRSRGRVVLPLTEVLSSSDDDETSEAAHATDPDATFHEVERLELHRRIRSVLSSLTPRQRRVVMLRLVAGWSCEDVARAEGTKVKTVKNLTWQARTLLRDAWDADRKAVRPLGWIGAAVVSVRLAMARMRARIDDVMTASLSGSSSLVGDRIAAAMVWAGATVATLVFSVAGPAAATALSAQPQTIQQVSTSAHRVEAPASRSSEVRGMSLRVAAPATTTGTTLQSSPRTTGRAAPPDGTLHVQAATPDGRVIAYYDVGWHCGAAPSNPSPATAPLVVAC